VKNGSDYNVSLPKEFVPLTQGIPGNGRDLDAAIRDAWDNRKSTDPKFLRVMETYVWGENPISGYHVVLGPGG
jgi:hypothetical protein